MSNYRELFDRLAKCNLPAGVLVGPHGEGVFVQVISDIRRLRTVGNTHDASECRAALMLVVDAMEAEGWWLVHGKFSGCSWATLLKPEPVPSRSVSATDPDEVTALAECLIAALGVAE